eukprot:scaffold92797_cov23-Tisochrysis_lutea.AAC.4
MMQWAVCLFWDGTENACTVTGCEEVQALLSQRGRCRHVHITMSLGDQTILRTAVRGTPPTCTSLEVLIAHAPS